MLTLPRQWIEQAFFEDAPFGDPASDLFNDASEIVQAHIEAKATGTICGLPLLLPFFSFLDPIAQVNSTHLDGEIMVKGQALCQIQCNLTAMLRTERLALNILSYLSGIATQTRDLVDRVAPHGVKLLDTRKILPHYRYLVKYAVRTGGGYNHRNSLSDLAMLKDNHIHAGGGISAILGKWKTHNRNPMLKVEIEVSSLKEALEALEHSPDIIMLDNFSLDEAEKTIQQLKGKVKIEISGGITKDNIENYARLGPDYISTGIMTHHIHGLDLSLNLD